jgi:hypothetical protein
VALRGRALHFPEDVLRIGGILRQDEHDCLGGIDGMNDLIGIERTGCHVPRGDPARNPTALERLDDGSGHSSVLRSIADEYGALRASGGSRPFFYVAFSHLDPLPRKVPYGGRAYVSISKFSGFPFLARIERLL